MKQILPSQKSYNYRARQILRHLAVLVVVIFSIFNGKLLSQNCVVNANVSLSLCANQPMTLTGTGAGLFNGVPLWSQYSGPSVLINNPNSFITNVTGYSAPNVYVFRLSATCADGSFVWDTVTFAVRPVTVAVGGPDQTLCPGQTGTLVGNVPVNPGETVQWIIVGPNNGVVINNPTSPTTTFTVLPTASGATNVRYQITNPNGCVSVDDFVVINNPGGVTPVNAGTDQSLTNCYAATQSTTLNGTYGGNGFLGQIGTWTVVSGPNIPSFGNVNLLNSTVSGLIQGIYVLRWTVAGPCVNGFDEVTITVPPPSADITPNTGSDQVFCDGRNSVVLDGTAPLYINETGLWTQTSGPGLAVFANPTSPTTSVTLPIVPGSYTFRWTITNSLTGCTSFADHTVGVYVNPTITANGGNDVIMLGCNITTASIPYTTTGNGAIYYNIVSGPTTGTYPVIPTPLVQLGASPLSLPGLTNPGTYVVRFYAVPGIGGGCSTATDDVSIVISRTPTSSNAGTSQFLACNITSTSLAANLPIVGTGQWSIVSGPGPVTFSNINSPVTTISGLVAGTYRLRWRISAGPMCPATQSTTTVRVATATPTVANAGPDATICYGTPYIMQANSPILNETGTWSVVPAAGVTFSNINSPTAVINGLAATSTYTFTWTISNACGTTSDNMIITTTNVAGPIQASAGPDQCRPSGTTTVTLAGNNPSPGTGLWTQLTGGAATITNNTLFNTSVTGMSNGTYTFEWAISSGGCTPTRDTVMITISAPTTPANAGPDQNVCGTSVTLAGNTPVIGTGLWTLNNGDAGAIITSPASPNTTVTNLIDGVYTFTWSISNNACSTTSDNVEIYVSQPPTVANAGPDQVLCGPSTTALAGNPILVGTGIWSFISGPNIPTFSSFTVPTATISGLITGTYTLRWTSSNGAYCPPTSDDVTIKVVLNANAGPDIIDCDITTVQLTGTVGSIGVWAWVSGPNTPLINTTGGNTATVTGMITGAYVFSYTVNDPSCALTSDQVNVTISGQPSTSNAGPDQDICHSGSITLAGNTPAIGTGTWTQIFGPAGATFSPNANTPNATVNVTAPSGTYVFVWTISDGGCSNADQVRVVDYALPTVANAGGDVNPLCGNVVTLAANTPIVGLGNWTQVSTTSGTNAVFSSNILPNAQASNLTPVDNNTPGVYTFRWTITSGPICPPSFDDVVISVFAPPSAPNAGPDNNFCNASSINLQGNPIAVGTGTWSLVSGPSVTFANINNPTTQVSLSAAGTYIFQWTAVNGPCSLTDQVVITNYATPTSAFAGPDQQICEFTSLFLNGNTPVAGTGLWSLQSGPSTVFFVNAASPNTQVLGTIPGTYIFKWTISNGICTPSNDFVSVTIYKTPSVANAGPNQSFCGSQTSATMAANTPVTGTGTWSQVIGPNFANIVNTGSPVTVISSLIRGTYIFRWTISNGTCTPSTSNVTIQVNNCAPTATPNAYTTNKNVPVSGNVILNGVPDSDPENDPLTVTTTPVLGPTNGSVILNADGTFTYTPNFGFSGIDTFTYEVCDNQIPKLCSTAVVTITVNYVNYPPVAYDNTNSTPEDTPVSGNVLTNGTPDSDPDGDPLTVTGISIGGVPYPINTSVLIPGVGTIIVAPNGNYTFTPLPNYNGTVPPIDYSISDGLGGVDVGTLFITVTPVNDPPVVTGTLVTTTEDTPITVCLPYTDIDNTINFTANVCGNPANGSISTPVIVGGQVCVTYTPNPNFNGTDSFCLQVCDNGSPVLCDTAIVTINILPFNDPPVAVNDLYSIPEDGTVTLTPLALDSDIDGGVLSIVSINGVLLTPGVAQIIPVPNGTVSISAGGVITFTPDPNFSGTVTFPYVISDGQGGTATANEIITITPVNDPPVAIVDTNTTPEDTPVSGTLVLNDSDVDGNLNPVGYSLVTGPSNGTVIINPNGSYTYTPAPGFSGPDSFIYMVCDLGLPVYCDTAIVFITVLSVNDAPIAVDDIYTTPEDTPISGNILLNDSDPDGNPIEVTNINFGGTNYPITVGIPTIINLPEGVLTINSDGSFTFNPAPGFNGPVPIGTYTINDGMGGVANADLIIFVNPVNDPPVAQDNSYTTTEDTPIITANILTDAGPFVDSDPDGDPLTVTSFIVGGVTYPAGATVNIPGIGVITIYSNGVLNFFPAANYTGPVPTIPYVITDGNGGTSTADIDIIVTAVNDTPVATANYATTYEDMAVTIPILGNDTDLDGALDPSTIDLDPSTPGIDLSFNIPGQGTYTVDPLTGIVTFTPDLNFNGQVTPIIYQVCDNGTPLPPLCDTAFIYVNVLPVNDPPVVTGTLVSTDEETPITICLPYTDIDNTINFTAYVCGNPLNGTISTPIISGGQVCVTYTPNPDFNGTDSFCVQVCDNGSPVLCDTAIITVSVLPVNDPPVAVDDAETTPEDTPVTIDVVGNDTDLDGVIDPTTVTIDSDPANGTVTVDPVTGEITYTPDSDFVGVDTFTYEVCDDGMPVLCDIATVTVTVTSAPDTTLLTTDEDTPVSFCTADYVNFGSSPIVSTSVCGDPANGTLTPNAGTTCFTYTPDPDWNGTDNLCIITCAANGFCDTTYFIITVNPVNDPPVAVDDVASTTEDTPVVIDVVGNDTDLDGVIDPTTVTINSDPANGTVMVDPVTGEITYTPDSDFVGVDTFTYEVCDDGMPVLCDIATVTVTVTSAPDTTLLTTDEDTPVSFCTADYVNFGSSPIVSTSVCGDPANGTLTPNAGTTCFTYTPDPDWNGTDNLCIITCAANGFCDTTYFIITVNPVNDPPIAFNEEHTICSSDVVTGNIRNGDYDPDLTWLLVNTTPVQGAIGGTFLIDTAGVYTYTPNASFGGTEVIVISLCDQGIPMPALCVNDTITIHVSPQIFASAGNDTIICETSDYYIGTAYAENYTSVYWTTSGSGYFNNDWTVNPVYTPSMPDIEAGSVVLTMHVMGIAPCSNMDVSMTLSISRQAVVNAGPDDIICETQGSYTLVNATGINAVSYLWTSSGDGSFTDPTIVNATYTPGPNDINAGSVVLTITGYSTAPCVDSIDQMTLFISRQAIVNAGEDNIICETSTYNLADATALYATSLLWTTTGTGSFSDPTTLNPVYTPSQNDIDDGFVYLILKGTSDSPCVDDIDTMLLNISRQSIANAGPDDIICETAGTYTLNGASAQYAVAYMWTSSGTGTFVDPTILNATYTPSIADITAGSVVLTLTTTSAEPCIDSVDQMTLFISRQAIVDAGEDNIICETGTYTLADATAQYTTSLLWTSTGTGEFDDPTLLHPVYTPSPADIINGHVFLILTGHSAEPCVDDIDSMRLDISRQSIAYAGPDDIICETAGTYTINGASAQYAVAYMWTSSGTGTFVDPTILNATYTPSIADITAGSVVLTLTTTSAEPCVDSVDQMTLFISRQAIVDAGVNDTICETGSFTIATSTAQFATSLLWTSTGTGSFDDPTVLHPVYTPSVNDIEDGNVFLILTGQSAEPCVEDVDSMLLRISRQSIAYAGPDDYICEGSTYTVTQATAQFATSILWTHNGLGTLENPTTINPTYVPAEDETGDITLTITTTSAPPCIDSVDFMILHITPEVIVNAGPNDTICEGSTYTLAAATAEEYASLLWTSSGTGSFDDPTALNPVYIPSQNDIDDGFVILTLTGFGNYPCPAISDEMVLYITRAPIANAGPDITVCQYDTPIYITEASASNYASLEWTHNGEGYISQANTIAPWYVPQAGEYGDITLVLTAYGNYPCPPARDTMIIHIMPAVEVYAGVDDTICEGSSYVLSTSYAAYFTGLQWTTTGTGSFSNGAALHPEYFPSQNDIDDGFVHLVLTGFANDPCVDKSDTMTLIITRAPLAYAGADAVTCQGTPYTIEDATAENYASLMWTHNGLGTIENETSIAPTYVPAANETGIVALVLTVNGNSPCAAVTDTMLLTINPAAIANAGNDDANCGKDPYTLSGASASGYTSLQWTTTGAGIFDNAHALNATYFPTESDILNGSVQLILTVIPMEACEGTSDTMTLILHPAPVANAGIDESSCQGSPFTVVSASAIGAETIIWTHNGLGTLSNETTLNPTYTPSSDETGKVVLVMTIQGFEPCGTVSDTMILNITPALVATAGEDISGCETAPITISGASAQNFASVLWTTSGSGSFDDPTLVNPVYTPSTADVTLGMVVLTMHVTANAPCSDFTDQLILTLTKNPVANAGPDQVACHATPYTLTGATAENYSILSWEYEPASAGTLTDNNTLTPTFTPAADFAGGQVTFTLKAIGSASCGSQVATDIMILTVTPQLMVNAGPDQLIPTNSAAEFLGTVEGGSGFYVWNWSPNELFVNENVYNPVTVLLTEDTEFTLSVLDLNSGCVGTDKVLVTLGAVVRPPDAIADTAVTIVNSSVLIDVLANDIITPGTNITVSLCSEPEHGTVVINSDNTIMYAPYANYVTEALIDDQFCYIICDDQNPVQCDTAMVYIEINDKSISDLDPTGTLTPNGDGSNDLWIIRGIEKYPYNEVIIFNRWGDHIKKITNYDNKDKVWRGDNEDYQSIPDGTYYYIIKINNVGAKTGWIFVRNNK